MKLPYTQQSRAFQPLSRRSRPFGAPFQFFLQRSKRLMKLTNQNAYPTKIRKTGNHDLPHPNGISLFILWTQIFEKGKHQCGASLLLNPGNNLNAVI